MASDRPLLTGGRYSGVVVRTGLTVVGTHVKVFEGGKVISSVALKLWH
jgi:hypothetical protein